MSDDIATAETTATEHRAELGILLVHGIGRQRQGEVVGQVADALFRWLRARVPDDGSDVRVAAAQLCPATRGSSEPAEVRLVLEGADGGSHEILLHESLWADEFHPPSPLHVLRWIIGPGAWLLLDYLLDTRRRLVHRMRATWGWPRPGWRVSEDNALFARAVRGVIGVSLLMALVIPIQLVGIVSWLAWLVPIDAVRQRLAAGFLAMSEILGDSYAFAGAPLVRAAVAGRVMLDLERLEKAASRVVVLAHSQGAAVAVEALLRRPATPPLLVTYGAGLRKLTALAEPSDQKRRAKTDRDKTPDEPVRVPAYFGWVWLLAVLTIASFNLSDVGYPLGVEHSPSIGGPLVALGWALFLVTFAFGWAAVFVTDTTEQRIDESLRPANEELLARGTRWLDLWASHDPVPAGPLLAEVTAGGESERTADAGVIPRVRSEMVIAEAGTLADHNAYWRSYDYFVDQLMEWLRDETGFSWLPAPTDDTRRRWRRIRAYGRRLVSMSLIGLALAMFIWLAALWWPSLVALGHEWLSGSLYDAMPEAVAWLAPTLAALALHLGVATAYLVLVFDPLWRAVDRRLAIAGPKPPTLGSLVAVSLQVVLLVLLALLPLVAAWEALVAGSYWRLLEVPLEWAMTIGWLLILIF